MSEEEKIIKQDRLHNHQVQRRRHYRLRYPENEGPELKLDDNKVYEIFEIAEGGARVSFQGTIQYDVNDFIHGQLLFRIDNGEDSFQEMPLVVKGTVLRIHEGVIVIKFDEGYGVPLHTMTEEQVRIRTKYPLISYNHTKSFRHT